MSEKYWLSELDGSVCRGEEVLHEQDVVELLNNADDLLSRVREAVEDLLEWSNDNPELIAILDRHLPETRV